MKVLCGGPNKTMFIGDLDDKALFPETSRASVGLKGLSGMVIAPPPQMVDAVCQPGDRVLSQTFEI